MLYSLEELVTGAVHKAFWESLQGQLDKNPPEYHQALGLLAEVKQVCFIAMSYIWFDGHYRDTGPNDMCKSAHAHVLI